MSRKQLEIEGEQPVKAMTLLEYQREIMNITKVWPIENKQEALVMISRRALNALGKSDTEVAAEIAGILRLVSEICDALPVSLQLVAEVSITKNIPLPPSPNTLLNQMKKE